MISLGFPLSITTGLMVCSCSTWAWWPNTWTGWYTSCDPASTNIVLWLILVITCTQSTLFNVYYCWGPSNSRSWYQLTNWLTHWHCRPHSTSSPHCAEVCCGMSSISTIQSRIYEWWCCRRKLQQESCDSCIITENLLLSPNALCTEPHCFCVSESRSLDPLPCSNKLTFCRELRDLRHQWRQTVDTKLEIPPSVMTSQKQFYFEIMKLVLMENIWYENTQVHPDKKSYLTDFHLKTTRGRLSRRMGKLGTFPPLVWDNNNPCSYCPHTSIHSSAGPVLRGGEVRKGGPWNKPLS